MFHSRAIVIALAVAPLLFLSASPPTQAAVLTHDYQLLGNYHDSLGGPDLVPAGGMLNATQGYSFGHQQGLSLSNGVNPTSYSILTTFRFNLDSPNGYSKILDFANLGPDLGLYVDPSNHLNFYLHATGTFTFPPNVDETVVLTRDGVTNVVAGYVNGVQEFSFVDSGGEGIFGGPNNIAWFFQDDLALGVIETSTGSVSRIEVWDGALTPAEVAAASAPVPEPSSLTLLGIGLAGISGYVWRRRPRATA